MGAILGALAARLAGVLANGLAAVLGRVLDALRIKRQDKDRIAAHERASVSEAAEETADVISEMVADRAAAAERVGADGGDAGRLAAGLRSRKSGAGGGHPNI